MRNVTPSKTLSIIGGGRYYDASSSSSYRDFVDYLGGSEDHHFTSNNRAIAIARFRREVRNNPYLSGLYETYPGAVGYGRAWARTLSREFNALKDSWWHGWAGRVTNGGDSLRRLTLMRHAEMLVAGEIFVVKLRSGRLQLIPSEYCGSPLKPNDKNELNGIVYNAAGRPIAYRFGTMTPQGFIDFKNSTLVDARHVIHDFKRDRIQMGRGIPWLISSLAPARDLYEITSAKTKQVKDAAKVTGTITSQIGDEALRKLGYEDDDDTLDADGNPASTDPVADQAADGPIKIELKDGTFIALEPGEKLEMLKNEYQASDYKELIFILLHAISAPPGLPVELWFSGLGQINYSGFKGLGTQWNRRRREIIEDCEDLLLDPIHDWRVDKALNELELQTPPEGIDPFAEKWAWQRTAVLDEEREAKTNEIRLRTGEDSLVDVWEREGRDPDQEMQKRRQLYIKMQIAAGRLTEGDDHSAVTVPFEFILTGELPKFRRGSAPSEVPVPVQDDGAAAASN